MVPLPGKLLSGKRPVVLRLIEIIAPHAVKLHGFNGEILLQQRQLPLGHGAKCRLHSRFPAVFLQQRAPPVQVSVRGDERNVIRAPFHLEQQHRIVHINLGFKVLSPHKGAAHGGIAGPGPIGVKKRPYPGNIF